MTAVPAAPLFALPCRNTGAVGLAQATNKESRNGASCQQRESERRTLSKRFGRAAKGSWQASPVPTCSDPKAARAPLGSCQAKMPAGCLFRPPVHLRRRGTPQGNTEVHPVLLAAFHDDRAHSGRLDATRKIGETFSSIPVYADEDVTKLLRILELGLWFDRFVHLGFFEERKHHDDRSVKASPQATRTHPD